MLQFVDSKSVVFTTENSTRIISLNRPEKLNALNAEMCQAILPRLLEFSKSDVNNLVILNSKTPKVFCSGGDVVQCAKDNLQGSANKSVDFFEVEYNLNMALATFNKPIVCLLNGIVMGGGAGLSVHTPFRVVCESTRFAMPETTIGFFNDVGTTFFLPRMDGNLGVYLGLTGDELSGLDAYVAGVGTHYVPEKNFAKLQQRLTDLELSIKTPEENPKGTFIKESAIPDPSLKEFYPVVGSAIEEFTEPFPSNYNFKYSKQQLDVIEKCFDLEVNSDVESIVTALEKEGSEFSRQVIAKLNEKSPISLKLSLEMMKRSSKTNIHEALKSELSLASNMMNNVVPNDFNECISKRLINRKSANPEDKIPQYAFQSLSEITPDMVDKLIGTALKTPTENIGSDARTVSNYFNITYNHYPYNFGLPSQKEVEDYVTGNDNTNRKYSVSKNEVVKFFEMKYGHKMGIRWKLNSLLERKTKKNSYDEAFLDWVD